jgi:hypothetical protein
VTAADPMPRTVSLVAKRVQVRAFLVIDYIPSIASDHVGPSVSSLRRCERYQLNT